MTATLASPITIPTLIEWIERQFPVGEPTTTYRSVTGEPYVVIGLSAGTPTTPGVVDEGALREAAFDEETACMGAAAAFREYAEGRTGTLYWRFKPQLEWDPDRRRCLVYMRLLISDKPAKKED